jgi:glutamate/tyrosine decarboxylase-like PLP-dependent enzyme
VGQRAGAPIAHEDHAQRVVGVIQDSASSAILCAFLTARERATSWRANEEGLGAVGPLRVYCSTKTHSATEKGLQRMIGEHIEWACQAADWIAAAPDFELMAPRSLALVTFRYHPEGVEDAAALDRLNERVLEALNDSGELYLTQTRVAGTYAMRLSIGQTWTRRRHVEAAWQKIQVVARALPVG